MGKALIQFGATIRVPVGKHIEKMWGLRNFWRLKRLSKVNGGTGYSTEYRTGGRRIRERVVMGESQRRTPGLRYVRRSTWEKKDGEPSPSKS